MARGREIWRERGGEEAGNKEMEERGINGSKGGRRE